jgi:hypothetical protein
MKTAIFAVLLLANPPAGSTTAIHPDRGHAARAVQKTPFPQIRDFRTLRITLRRTMCFGICPDYSVDVHGDGRVRYFGSHHVKAKGQRLDRIPQREVRRLYDAFRSAEFFNLRSSYRAAMTDMPTYEISISFDGHTKTVTDYRGEAVGMPKSVTALENLIDEVVGTDRWTGRREP